MSIKSLEGHNLSIAKLSVAAAASVACLALLAGCKSSSGSTAGGAASGQPAAGGTSAAAAGSFKAACPATSEVSATLGETYPAPKVSSASGTLLCNYNNGNNNLVIEFAQVPGTSVADLKGAMDAQAQGQKTSDNTVSGLGDGAYEFSSTNSGSTQTVVDILSGSEDIDLTSDVSAAQTEALAHDVVGS
jgi:hypothetical protein